MNNFYTRVVVGIFLLATFVIILISIGLRADTIKEEMSKPRKDWKFEKRRLFVDLPEEEISKDESNPDTVIMFVRNDTLYVGYFHEY
jgi:hypothetical protein